MDNATFAVPSSLTFGLTHAFMELIITDHGLKLYLRNELGAIMGPRGYWR